MFTNKLFKLHLFLALSLSSLNHAASFDTSFFDTFKDALTLTVQDHRLRDCHGHTRRKKVVLAEPTSSLPVFRVVVALADQTQRVATPYAPKGPKPEQTRPQSNHLKLPPIDSARKDSQPPLTSRPMPESDRTLRVTDEIVRAPKRAFHLQPLQEAA